jgi:hypothetical protein
LSSSLSSPSSSSIERDQHLLLLLLFLLSQSLLSLTAFQGEPLCYHEGPTLVFVSLN